MKVRLPLQKFLLALCVLAVVSAQLFGVGRSFLCLCSGAPVAMASDHCHGPHGEDCHAGMAPAHSAESCPDDGDKHTHAQVAQNFQSLAAHTDPLVLTAPLMFELLMLEDSEWAKVAPVSTLENAADLRGSPPCGVAVARTVVLLI